MQTFEDYLIEHPKVDYKEAKSDYLKMIAEQVEKILEVKNGRK